MTVLGLAEIREIVYKVAGFLRLAVMPVPLAGRD
jgi:hypothetical protein